MPYYNYKCEQCNCEEERFLSIKEYLDTPQCCTKCNLVLKQIVVSPKANVEKSTDQILLEIKEDVQKTVERIRQGDQRTIDDIFGDQPNPYKT